MRIPKGCLSHAGRAPDLCHMALLDPAAASTVQPRTERGIKGGEASRDEAGVVPFQILQCLGSRHGREPVLATRQSVSVPNIGIS
jgi:hypothetical protein